MRAWLPTLQHIVRWFTAISFMLIGVVHFTHTHIFVLFMPPYLPWHTELVLLSGVFEIAGGLGLLLPQTRTVATWGLLALLLAVFPANIQMAVTGIELPLEWLPQSESGRWMRLPWQGVIALQVWFSGLWKPPEPPGAGDASPSPGATVER